MKDLFSKKVKLTQGFTLIELLVVIAIIGILGAIVYAPFQTARRKGRDAQKIVEMKNLSTAISLYANSHNGEYPPNMATLRDSMTDKLPAKVNFSNIADLSKYNYTAYANNSGNGVVLAYHLYTHLETNSPALYGAAKCFGGANLTAPGLCAYADDLGPVPSSTAEPQNGFAAFFTDRSQDTDSICATDITKCIFDIKG